MKPTHRKMVRLAPRPGTQKGRHDLYHHSCPRRTTPTMVAFTAKEAAERTVCLRGWAGEMCPGLLVALANGPKPHLPFGKGRVSANKSIRPLSAHKVLTVTLAPSPRRKQTFQRFEHVIQVSQKWGGGPDTHFPQPMTLS